MATAPSLTMRQLAKLAGVSRSTASLAMQNDPRLAQATRERVRKIAAQKGYKPDPLTSTLMNQLRKARSKRHVEKLAYLTPWNPRDWQSGTNYLNWFKGASQRAESLGYELEAIWTKEPGMTSARLSKILNTRAIRGIIIAHLLRSRGHLSLNWEHLAPATIGHSVVKPELHRASHSHYKGILMATRHLRHLGYRRIGLACLVDQLERVNYSWLAGYLVHSQRQPSSQRLPAFQKKTWNRKEFLKWVKQYRPDVVISNHSEPWQFLREGGYTVPADIGFAHLDLTVCPKAVAGIDQQPLLLGAAAVDLVVAQLQGNELGLPACAKTTSIEGIWRDGPTIRPHRQDPV